MAFTDNLRRLMQRDNQTALTLAADMTRAGEPTVPATIQNWLEGGTPSSDKLLVVAGIFRVSIDAIVSDGEIAE